MLYEIKKPPFLVKQGFTGQKYFRFPITPEANAEIQIELKISTGSGTSTYLVNYFEDDLDTTIESVKMTGSLFNDMSIGISFNEDSMVLAVGAPKYTWSMAAIEFSATGKTDGVYIGNPVLIPDRTKEIQTSTTLLLESTSADSNGVSNYLQEEYGKPDESIAVPRWRDIICNKTSSVAEAILVRSDNTLVYLTEGQLPWEQHPGADVTIVDSYYCTGTIVILLDNGDLYVAGDDFNLFFDASRLVNCLKFVCGGIVALHYEKYTFSTYRSMLVVEHNDSTYSILGKLKNVANDLDGSGNKPVLNRDTFLLRPLILPTDKGPVVMFKVVMVYASPIVFFTFEDKSCYYISSAQRVCGVSGAPTNLPVQCFISELAKGDEIYDVGLVRVVGDDSTSGIGHLWEGWLCISEYGPAKITSSYVNSNGSYGYPSTVLNNWTVMPTVSGQKAPTVFSTDNNQLLFHTYVKRVGDYFDIKSIDVNCNLSNKLSRTFIIESTIGEYWKVDGGVPVKLSVGSRIVKMVSPNNTSNYSGYCLILTEDGEIFNYNDHSSVRGVFDRSYNGGVR